MKECIELENNKYQNAPIHLKTNDEVNLLVFKRIGSYSFGRKTSG